MTETENCNKPQIVIVVAVVAVLLFYVHGKPLRSCWGGQLT